MRTFIATLDEGYEGITNVFAIVAADGFDARAQLQAWIDARNKAAPEWAGRIMKIEHWDIELVPDEHGIHKIIGGH
jgi:hypothetical protein